MKTAIQFAAAFIVLAVIYLFSGYQHHLKTVRLDPIPQIDTAPVPQPVAPVKRRARNVPADQTTRECRGLRGCLD